MASNLKILFSVATRNSTFRRMGYYQTIKTILYYYDNLLIMVPGMQNPCQYPSTEYRLVPTPLLPLPSNHILLYYLCPCRVHRIHFTIHRSVLLSQISRNQSITQNIRTQQHLQRLAEMQLQARFRRIINHKEYNGLIQVIEEQEEEIDR